MYRKSGIDKHAKIKNKASPCFSVSRQMLDNRNNPKREVMPYETIDC